MDAVRGLMHDALSIPERISAAAELVPRSFALTHGNQPLTYAELNRRADLFGAYMARCGVRPGCTVAICLERSFDWIVAALGIMRAGAAYVPLDPAWPDLRCRFALKDSASMLLVARAALLDRFQIAAGGVDPQRDAELIAASPACARVPVNPHSLAYVIYTSGSTGTPKGVEITHANLIHLARWHQNAFNVNHGDRASHLAGLGFDAAAWELWPNLCAGATVCLADDMVRSSASLIKDWLIRDRITISFVPTVHAAAMMRMDWPAATELRFMLTGGDVLHQGPPPGLPFEVVNNYGPTECTVVATSALLQAGATGSPAVGRPIAGAAIYLLDEHGAQVADGQPGEIYIGGDGVGRGYRNLPESTAGCFLADPFSREPDGRLYRTGDRGLRRPDGEIEFCGRLDRQVKVRGQRVELDEIGAVLSRHPSIEFATVAFKAAEGGQSHLVAYVLPKEGGGAPSSAEMQKHLQHHLPDYMIPSAFMELHSLPLSPGAKVDTNLIEQSGNTRHLEQTADELAALPVASKLLGMFREILDAPAMTADDNFFLAGGHSLLGMQLVTRMRAIFDVELTFQEIFDAPTVNSLAPLLTARLRDARSPAVPPPGVFILHPQGTRPNIFWMHSLFPVLVAKELGDHQPFVLVTFTPQDLALLGEKPPMKDIAACMLSKIRATQPTGSYIIAGRCIGSVLAYEVASQLRAAGEEVSILLMIDAPTQPYIKLSTTLITRLKHPRFYLYRAATVIGWRRSLTSLWNRTIQNAPDLIPSRFRVNEKHIAYRTIMNAAFDYYPTTYDGRTVLLLAKERGPLFNFLPGWQSLISNLETFYVQGRHRELITSSNVQEVANLIRNGVNQCSVPNISPVDASSWPANA